MQFQTSKSGEYNNNTHWETVAEFIGVGYCNTDSNNHEFCIYLKDGSTITFNSGVSIGWVEFVAIDD